MPPRLRACAQRGCFIQPPSAEEVNNDPQRYRRGHGVHLGDFKQESRVLRRLSTTFFCVRVCAALDCATGAGFNGASLTPPFHWFY